ncbi:MAG: hypothetical protein AB7K09_04800 [Planctomycetota bacterium]
MNLDDRLSATPDSGARIWSRWLPRPEPTAAVARFLLTGTDPGKEDGTAPKWHRVLQWAGGCFSWGPVVYADAATIGGSWLVTFNRGVVMRTHLDVGVTTQPTRVFNRSAWTVSDHEVHHYRPAVFWSDGDRCLIGPDGRWLWIDFSSDTTTATSVYRARPNWTGYAAVRVAPMGPWLVAVADVDVVVDRQQIVVIDVAHPPHVVKVECWPGRGTPQEAEWINSVVCAGDRAWVATHGWPRDGLRNHMVWALQTDGASTTYELVARRTTHTDSARDEHLTGMVPVPGGAGLLGATEAGIAVIDLRVPWPVETRIVPTPDPCRHLAVLDGELITLTHRGPTGATVASPFLPTTTPRCAGHSTSVHWPLAIRWGCQSRPLIPGELRAYSPWLVVSAAAMILYLSPTPARPEASLAPPCACPATSN